MFSYFHVFKEFELRFEVKENTEIEEEEEAEEEETVVFEVQIFGKNGKQRPNKKPKNMEFKIPKEFETVPVVKMDYGRNEYHHNIFEGTVIFTTV